MKIKVRFTYYKRTGKHYSSGVAWYETDDFPGCIYPREFGYRALQLKALPGLLGGTWDGPFTVECKGYPELCIDHVWEGLNV